MKKIYYSSDSRTISQPKPKVLYPVADDGISAGRRSFFCHPSTILANKSIKPWMDCLPAVENQKYQLEKKLLACLNLQGLPVSKSLHAKKTAVEENNAGTVKTICLEGCRYDVVRRIALELGFRESTESEFWNILWTDTPISLDKALDMRRLQDAHKLFWGPILNTQKTNHFPGMHEICRKDRLARNLNRMQKLFNDEYSFFPKTWSLPADVPALLANFQTSVNPTFICKPDSGCQGKGIFLVRNLKKINPFAKLIAQVYIPNPLLIDGYKFDLRIYILITSCDPLRIYIYNEGIARFATVKYLPPNDKNIDIVFMHLTNYSLNKFSQSYVAEPEGSKRKLSTIYGYFVEKGHNVGKLIEDIDDVIIKTVIAAQPTLRHYYRASFPKDDRGSSCFEVLGFDILIDDNLKPWLIEVNLSPSFNLDLAVDAEIKERLLRDTFNKIYLGTLKQKPMRETQLLQKGVLNLPPPAYTEIMDKAGNQIPKMLQKQFYHEQLNQGNFRLVYPGENCKKYTRFLDPLVNLPAMNDLANSSRHERPHDPYTHDIEELSSSRGQVPSKILLENKSISPITSTQPTNKTNELPYVQIESGEIGQASELVKGKFLENSTMSSITQQKLEFLKSAAEAVAVSGGNIEELLSTETSRQPMNQEPMESKVSDVVKMALILTQRKEHKRLKKTDESKESSCTMSQMKDDSESGIIVNHRDGLSRINHKDYCQTQRIKTPCVSQPIKMFDHQLLTVGSNDIKQKPQTSSFDLKPFPTEVFRSEPIKSSDFISTLNHSSLPLTPSKQKVKKLASFSKKIEQELRISCLQNDGDSYIPTAEKLKRFCLDSTSQGKGSRVSKNKLIEEWILSGDKKTPKKIFDEFSSDFEIKNNEFIKTSSSLSPFHQRRAQASASIKFSSLVLTQEENERTQMLKEREKKIRQMGVEGKIFQMMKNTGKLSFEEELIYKKIYSEEEFKANKNGNSTLLIGYSQSVSHYN